MFMFISSNAPPKLPDLTDSSFYYKISIADKTYYADSVTVEGGWVVVTAWTEHFTQRHKDPDLLTTLWVPRDKITVIEKRLISDR
jgi:hypothetical protein